MADPNTVARPGELSIHSRIKMKDGHTIPVLGFGTYELEGKEAYESVRVALEAGYRHIDSAAWYENEKEVGKAILDFCHKSGVPRSEVFYTSKLKLNNGYANVKQAIQRSLDECGLGYIDLYLIHGPLGGPLARTESWRAICDFQRDSGGLLRTIGISTFGIRHMKDIIESGLPLPVVHQIDLHPFMTRTEIVKYSTDHGLTLEAWAPLVRGLRFNQPEVQRLSKKHNKRPSQILIRYSLQKGFVPLPKSARPTRIVENADVFDFLLSDDDIQTLDSLDEGLVTDWDPTDCA